MKHLFFIPMLAALAWMLSGLNHLLGGDWWDGMADLLFGALLFLLFWAAWNTL